MKNKLSILKILTDLKEEIESKYNATIKGIFGSYAREEENENSDIDILVDFHEEADLFDVSGLALFLREKLNLKVDLIPEDSIREEIKDYILKDTVYI
ncbi:MAG TPA: nucleotidyltransferase family protein [Candidatus Eremiobacteraeota bacterium]|nr:MAG: Nucleotidyltransferase domain protein [bacterium ADurb.Bin363]HPZ10662.1 nucleotidyltransferase family protein [Candidatus Eremiobacteraeota bacterium]